MRQTCLKHVAVYVFFEKQIFYNKCTDVDELKERKKQGNERNQNIYPVICVLDVPV